MSWWISLEDEDGRMLTSEKSIQEGGTQFVGGTDECTLNVTYNYSDVTRLVGFQAQTASKKSSVLVEGGVNPMNAVSGG